MYHVLFVYCRWWVLLPRDMTGVAREFYGRARRVVRNIPSTKFLRNEVYKKDSCYKMIDDSEGHSDSEVVDWHKETEDAHDIQWLPTSCADVGDSGWLDVVVPVGGNRRHVDGHRAFASI